MRRPIVRTEYKNATQNQSSFLRPRKNTVRRSAYQRFQCSHISASIAGLINWRLSDKRSVFESRIVQQAPEWLRPDCSLPDVLVAVELRSARCLGIVTVEY